MQPHTPSNAEPPRKTDATSAVPPSFEAAPPSSAASAPPEAEEEAPVVLHHDPWARKIRSTAVGPTMHSRHERKLRRTPPPEGWAAWWPVAVGVVLAIFATDLRRLALLWDPWGLRLLFPYYLLAGKEELGLSPELARTLPQLMLFLQFPLEGFLSRISLRRGMKLSSVLGQVLFLHLVGAMVLFLISGVTPQ
jgi:hypothetical protein